MKYENLKLGEVLRFWFEELTPEDWFSGSAEVDDQIIKRFSDIHAQVVAGEFWKFRTDAHSFLAEIIVLDQFSRQMFRGSGEAFAHDAQALTLAQQGIAQNLDSDLTNSEKQFFYMPFMHSESKVIHTEALVLFESLGNEEALKYEKIHKAIIDQFGRYPHRNELLGRTSTSEESEYLENNQEAFF